MDYTIYKVTNLANGKIYIGLHKTDDVDDGYMGSGKLLKRAIVKYGRDTFSKEVMYRFDTLDAAIQKEREIVNEDFVARSDTYNICVGGGLGGKQINGLTFEGRTHNESTKKLISRAMKGNKHGVGRKLTVDHKKRIAEHNSKLHKGVAKTEEHKQKISESISQKWKDSNYRSKERNKGKRQPFMWITDGKTNKRLTNDSDIPEGWVRGKTENSVWITDGHNNRKMAKGDTLPDGWNFGRTI
jgi:hypothetical protein